MYALPGSSIAEWTKDLEIASGLGAKHISLYGLTIEKKTVFGTWKSSGSLTEMTEDFA